jgi:hypothetical protein
MNEKVSTDSRAKRGRSSGLLRRDSGKPARYAATGLTKKDEGAWSEKRARRHRGSGGVGAYGIVMKARHDVSDHSIEKK